MNKRAIRKDRERLAIEARHLIQMARIHLKYNDPGYAILSAEAAAETTEEFLTRVREEVGYGDQD